MCELSAERLLDQNRRRRRALSEFDHVWGLAMGLANQQGMVHSPFVAVKIPGGFNARDPFNRLGLMIQAQVAAGAVLTQYIAFSNWGSHGGLIKA